MKGFPECDAGDKAENALTPNHGDGRHGFVQPPRDVMSDQKFLVEPVNDSLRPRVQGELYIPRRANDWGALVLGGSSGRLDGHAAGLLAGIGVTVFAQRWFGYPGLPDEISEVPLEIFMEGIDLLQAHGCSQVAVLGRSRGAEAALLLAVHDARPDAVFALSPSSVAWAGSKPNGRSSWTLKDKGVPFVPYDLSWWEQPHETPIEYREYHEASLRLDPRATARAQIEIQRTAAEVTLVAGVADALWPSDTFARSIAQRLRTHGKACNLIVHSAAGHRVLLPGETTPRSTAHAHGGTDQADTELGTAAWGAIERCVLGRSP